MPSGQPVSNVWLKAWKTGNSFIALLYNSLKKQNWTIIILIWNSIDAKTFFWSLKRQQIARHTGCNPYTSKGN